MRACALGSATASSIERARRFGRSVVIALNALHAATIRATSGTLILLLPALVLLGAGTRGVYARADVG